jgi:hypothetical protein
MYKFSLSQDKDLIRSVVLASNNLLFNFDDSYPDPYSFQPIFNENIYYIKCEDQDDNFLGFFFLIKGIGTDVIAESHMAFLPVAYGKVANIGKECLQWVWDNTAFNTLVCPCIETNRLALKCIKAIGFQEYGREDNKWVSKGKIEHYILLKATKIL